MRARRWIVAGLGIVLLVVVPGVAAASPGAGPQTAAARATAERASGSPRMLAYNASARFVRRPATVVPYGNSAAVSTVLGRLTATRGKPIHWVRWNRTEAYGRGTLWQNDMTPTIAQGTWRGRPATLRAYRVVNGRYTRLTVRYRKNGTVRTSRMRLVKHGAGFYAWRVFVRVPSWRDFRSSYTGDDWTTIIESTIAAIEDGFAKAHLIADVQLVNGWDEGSTAYQRPKAGTMVQTGTIVHIRIPVYD